MKKQQQQSVTSLPQSPLEERHSRMIKYSIAMGTRLLCLAALLFVHEWYLMIALGVAAVVLPWLAVVIANTGANTPGTMNSPGGQLVALDQVPPTARQREFGGRPE
ncbi:DUF3099 domain-containing protein [Subtercola sp. YIM 133946]|uniref:DUF3099 domain-containing protein n=1 Tax=Subtercola sp. YIM 133946 TaxID=3118909 RepID=UPI002F95F2AD